MEGKPVQSSPSFLAALQARWREDALSATAVGVVGVGLNEADRHIWSPLEETAARIVVIGNQADYGDWFARKRAGRSNSWIGSKFSNDSIRFVEALAA